MEDSKITFGPNGLRDSFLDEFGNPVPECSATVYTGCDEVGPTSINAGQDLTLQTRRAGDDEYTKPLRDCLIGGDYDATATMMSQLRALVIGHEVGHGIHLVHTDACGTIMYTYEDPVTSDVFSVLSVYPIPVDFTLEELSMIRLFR